MTRIEKPYLLFLGDADSEYGAKTAEGIRQWRPEDCVAQMRLPGCTVDLDLADMAPAEARAHGARTMILGIAARGGKIPEFWVPHLLEALDAGLDLAAGLHNRLRNIPALRERADALGRKLHDVREPPAELPLGTGIRRPGRRVLMIGTDCAVGKKFTALAVHREMVRRGINATFRATGQTGVMISGEGIALDAVPGDFISGCAEALTPAASDDHWDVIEGQATVLHPTFAAVTLGLVHGSQPDAMILCHQGRRETVRGLGTRPLPSLTATIEAHVAAARVNSPKARVVAVSVNTGGLNDGEASQAIAAAADETGLPATDPLRRGAGVLVDALI